MLKNILIVSILSLSICNSFTQVKMDTVNFKTGVERILADHPSKFQNIKVSDTCDNFCPLKFYINDSFYPFCEVSPTYDREKNYSCTITYSNYDFQPENSVKYRGYTDTDSLTMNNFMAEIKKTLFDAVQKTFGTVKANEYNCDIISDKETCREYILQTEDINQDHEYFEVKLKMVKEYVKDGSTYWYTSIQFEMNKW